MSKMLIPSMHNNCRCRLGFVEKPQQFSLLFNLLQGEPTACTSYKSAASLSIPCHQTLTLHSIFYTTYLVMNRGHYSSVADHEQDTLPRAWTMTLPRSLLKK